MSEQRMCEILGEIAFVLLCTLGPLAVLAMAVLSSPQ